LRHEAEAREVLQEVFLSLVENPSQFSGASSPTTWLYSATTHRCLNLLRNQRTRARLLDQHGEFQPIAGEPCPPDTFLALASALGELPDEVAKAAIYFHLDGMSYEEIAQILDCSRRKVANLLASLKESPPAKGTQK
jgi:RNA polymerase sigma factor (sigma-70 family)